MQRPLSVPVLVIVSVLILMLTGCHKDTVVGKWQGTAPGPGGVPLALTINFTEDGKEAINAVAQGGPVSFTVNLTGDYKVDGANLTQTMTSITTRSQTFNLPPSRAQPQTAPFTLSGDTLTLTNPQSGQTMTLTRVKE